MKELGRGSPLVIIPGIQGRWEWMAPAVRALAGRHRVLTFSLDEADGESGGRLFPQWTGVIDRLLDRAAEPAAALVGVSFGGLVAAYYAAVQTSRVTRLILVSPPSPRWKLDRRSAAYARRPRLSLPLFAVRGVSRLGREVAAALPTVRERAGFAAQHLGRVLRYPVSPRHMARCVGEWEAIDLAAMCRQITAPTLVITGEARLDRVVPVERSLDFLAVIPHARHVTLERTGHLGLVLRPEEFAGIVTGFVEHPAGSRRERERCT